MELFIYLTIFIFIYTLNKRISHLELEVAMLKKNQDKPLDTTPLPQNIEALESSPLVNTETSIDTKNSSLIVKVFNFFKEYFTTGNILVRIGGVLLFFGLAFFVKYIAQNNLVSVQIRLIVVAIIALVILLIGWQLRQREGHYGTILQGLGIAILYLVVFSSSKLYGFVSLEFAFILMFLIVVLGSLLAVIQNALYLALFATVGGFLSPILVSDGNGSHIVLFTYYALLDLGIFAIAWYRSWRILNISGFFFTFIIATAWGILRYESEFFLSTEAFLILFFLFYLAISIISTLKQPVKLEKFIDSTLVFGLPLIAFSLQTSLIDEREYGVLYSAIIVGSLYMILAKIFFKSTQTKLLAQSFLALGVIFYTIAIPYAFDDHISLSLWAIESVAIIWIALQQNRNFVRIVGQVLQIFAIILFIFNSLAYPFERAFMNAVFLEYTIIVGASLWTSYLLYSLKKDDILDSSSQLFLYIALGVLLFSGLLQTEILDFPQGNSMLIYIALNTGILIIIASILKWSRLIDILQLYLFVGIIFFITLLSEYATSHPFEGIGFIAITLFFLLHFILLYRFDTSWSYQSRLHPIGLWVLVLLLMLESHYHSKLISSNLTWQAIGLITVPIIFILGILFTQRFLPASLQKYRKNYRIVGVGGLMLMVGIWQFYGFTLDGDPLPLSYIPIFNPLDLVQILGVTLLIYWLSIYRDNFISYDKTALFISAFLLLIIISSVILARSIHFYLGVEYAFLILFDNLVFQSGLSILWSIIAISMMLLAQKYQNRSLWLSAMGLLLVVIVKLFIIELSNSATVERIISFVSVGFIMLVIGYFAPFPPKKESIKEES